jgi:hypothetical protein
MKPFHYNQDPLYAAAASILTGQQLTEEVVAFKNLGFKLVNGLMSDEDIHDAVNSSIKSAVQKLGDSTWDVVTDIYGKRANGEWAGDWIMARKGGGSWLTIKDGGPFKAHDSISSVLSFFEIEEEMEEAKGYEFASLLGKQVHHGSPGYPTPEVIASITPHQTQSGKFEIEFKSGTFDVLSMDDLDELMNGAEVHFKSPHGGMTVIELKGDKEMEEAKDYKLASLSLEQLQTRFTSLGNQIGYLEDKQGFAPEELKAEFRALDAEIESRKGMKEGDEDFHSQKMIKNQLNTIVRNSNICLQMIEDDREFPEWAQSEIAVAEAGIVSVTEYMESHSDGAKLDEASPFKMGTATITSPGNPLHGKQANVFHKFDDGRINVQYEKSDRKGDVLNITLNKGQYKLDSAMSEAYTIKTNAVRAVMGKFTMLDPVELEDFFKAAQSYFAEEGDEFGLGDFNDLAFIMGRAAKRWSNREGN